jgi:Dyp-type peroxidase family
MTQAKGILPRGKDRDVLYKNPRTCGYFVGVKLDPALDRARAEAWLGKVSVLIDQLVERLPAKPGEKKGEKIAAVAVGLAPSFFGQAGQNRFEPAVEPPAAFKGDHDRPLPNQQPPLSAVSTLDVDVMFYIASTFEARVNDFVSQLAQLRPDVQSISLDRGYQRVDGTEPFGYADGLRNIRTAERSRFVFVHRDDRQLEEPFWADGGSYMAFMRILQRPDQFAALADDNARDQVIGRTKDGTRLDLAGQGVHPHDEPASPPPATPPSSHVRKAGPRGEHDDNQIFRRGLPFMETAADGQLRIGLNFCSFQASLEQFDVVFNDWMMSAHFPNEGAQADALLDATRQLTSIEKVGFYFVPPHDEQGLAHAVFAERTEHGKPPTGRLVVRKRVVDATDINRRFERRGFNFQVLDAAQQLIPGTQFSTDSTGRGICPVDLPIDQSYTLQELPPMPVQNVQPTSAQFTMDKTHKELPFINQVTEPNTPYGGS